MAKLDNKTKEAFDDLDKYKYGAIMSKMLDEKRVELFPGVAELYYAERCKAANPEGLEDLVLGALLNNKGGIDPRKAAILTQDAFIRYEEAKRSLNVGEWFNHYKGIVGNIAEREEIKKVISDFKDKKIGKLEDSIAKLKYEADDPNPKPEHKDKVNKAKKELEKYNGITQIMSMVLDQLYANNLKKITEVSNRYKLKALQAPASG